MCREVMLRMMRGGDSILKEQDETLMIRYVLCDRHTVVLNISSGRSVIRTAKK